MLNLTISQLRLGDSENVACPSAGLKNSQPRWTKNPTKTVGKKNKYARELNNILDSMYSRILYNGLMEQSSIEQGLSASSRNDAIATGRTKF